LAPDTNRPIDAACKRLRRPKRLGRRAFASTVGRASVTRDGDDLEAAVELDVVLVAVLALDIVGFKNAGSLRLLLEGAAFATPIGKRRLDLADFIVGRLGIRQRHATAKRHGQCNASELLHSENLLFDDLPRTAAYTMHFLQCKKGNTSLSHFPVASPLRLFS